MRSRSVLWLVREISNDMIGPTRPSYKRTIEILAYDAPKSLLSLVSVKAIPMFNKLSERQVIGTIKTSLGVSSDISTVLLSF
jgi:hypothetical protein